VHITKKNKKTKENTNNEIKKMGKSSNVSIGADDGGVTLDFETERKIYGYSEVSSGRIQVEFRHFREPGQDEEV